MKNRLVQYVKTNLDDIAIVTALGHIAASSQDLSEEDLSVLAALQRANPGLGDASHAEISQYLSEMDSDQLLGLTSNVKGILHEMQFVRVENEDGDSVYAAMFESTNHAGYDVVLVDELTGDTIDLQLKATENASAVENWIEEHPDGEILVTEELADELGLESSGISNEALSVEVDTFVDKMLEGGTEESLWGYLPALGVVSVSMVVAELWERKQRGEITEDEFRSLAARSTGMKVGKMAAIVGLLSIPFVGQVVGAVLIARLLISAKATWFDEAPPIYDPAKLPAPAVAHS